jgi:hypothetical protein
VGRKEKRNAKVMEGWRKGGREEKEREDGGRKGGKEGEKK